MLRLKELEGQATYDIAVKFDSNMQDSPLNLIHETVNCQDETSGNVVEYTVIDYIISTVSGNGFYVLEDGEGNKRQVGMQEVHKICVDSAVLSGTTGSS